MVSEELLVSVGLGSLEEVCKLLHLYGLVLADMFLIGLDTGIWWHVLIGLCYSPSKGDIGRHDVTRHRLVSALTDVDPLDPELADGAVCLATATLAKPSRVKAVSVDYGHLLNDAE